MSLMLRQRRSVLPCTVVRFPQVSRESLCAMRVQQHLFPQRLPHLAGWDLAASCHPARTLAGDYHDVFNLGEGRVALALGDVSGKGLGPALVMAGLHALVRCCLPPRSNDLTGVMAQLNQYLEASTPDDMFVTLFLAVLETATGRLRYVNAGHPAPLVLSGNGETEVVRLRTGGPLLGVLPGASFDEGSCDLAPDSLLAVFSDGITEAESPVHGPFLEQRLIQHLQASWRAPAERMREDVLKSVLAFTGQPEPADDLSLILMRRDPASPPDGDRGSACV